MSDRVVNSWNAEVPVDWLIPDWPAPEGVHSLCTTRSGGVSAAPFDSFNLGDHVGDDAAAVAANRHRLAEILDKATPHTRPVFLQQVHGVHVQALHPQTPDALPADACVSTQPGVACTIMVADCLPVLFCSTDGSVVAAAHAGWRGLAGSKGYGVLESTLAAMAQRLGQAGEEASSSQIMAWLGPCIGPTAFEVGEEVRVAFCSVDEQADQFFTASPGGKHLADLAGLARQRLLRAGVAAVYGNDSGAPWCTVQQASRFFSHRRDTLRLGGSGRFAACVWLG